MFSKHSIVKLFVAVAVAASIAVVGARSVHAQTFVTDTLGGNGHPKVPAVQGYRLITDTLAPGGMSLGHRWFLIEHSAPAAQPEGYRFITDTLAGNGYPYNGNAYVPGGASQQLSQAVQSLGRNTRPAPTSVLVSSGSGFDWSNVEIGAGSAAAALMLLLAAGLAVRTNRHRVAAA